MEQNKNASSPTPGASTVSLLIKIDRYLRCTKMPVSKFGRLACNDPRLVTDLRRGRRPGPAVIERVDAFLRDSMPREMQP
jgi:hypothetical protein